MGEDIFVVQAGEGGIYPTVVGGVVDHINGAGSGDVRQATWSVRQPDLYKKSGPPSFSLVLLASSSDHSCLDKAN